MVPVAESTPRAPEAAQRPLTEDSRQTRGFLFADLRDFTRFVEQSGAAAAADLLVRYRAMVRDAVDQARGAEIRTEGDSFYVVFPSASLAVECGMAIVASAAAAATADVPRIDIGVGIHAGETIETPEGLVGSAVNIAARVCAIARPDEVLVTDTVRSLTRSAVEATFVSRGRHQLKGFDEPVELFAVRPAGSVVAARPRRLPQPTAILAAGLGTVVVLALAAVGLSGLVGQPGSSQTPSPSAGTSPSSSPVASAAPLPTARLPLLPATGRIPAGRYRTAAFGSDLGLELELDDGWTQVDTFGDLSDYLGLRESIHPSNSVELFVARHLSADGCFDITVDVADADTQAISGRLAEIPGLVWGENGNRPASPSLQGDVVVAGPFVDLRVESGHACEPPPIPPAVYILPVSENQPVSPDPGANWSFLSPGEAGRYVVFDWPGAGSGLAEISSASPAALNDFLPHAEQLLDGIQGYSTGPSTSS
jgi:class 3 adenylate cyclase